MKRKLISSNFLLSYKCAPFHEEHLIHKILKQQQPIKLIFIFN